MTNGLRSLASMAHLLMHHQPLNDLLETAADHAREALGAATVSISRVDADGDTVRTIVNSGDLGPGELRWPDDEVYSLSADERLATVIRERQSSVDSLDDPDTSPAERALLERLDKGSSLATAVVVDGRSWGEFYATRHVGVPVFDGDAIAYAEVLVAILSAAVSRALREAALEELAFHDPLTGLYNRRGLDEHGPRLLVPPAGQTCRISIAAFDIDNLKAANDTYGHQAGDEVIRSVAEVLEKTFGQFPDSLVARSGGDEFLVVVPHRPVEDVREAADEVCRAVSGSGTAMGVSAGIAVAWLGAASRVESEELFAEADRALYVAKRAGAGFAVVSEDFTV